MSKVLLTGVLWNFEIDNYHPWVECCCISSAEYLETWRWKDSLLPGSVQFTFGQLFNRVVDRFSNPSLIDADHRWSEKDLWYGEPFHVHPHDLVIIIIISILSERWDHSLNLPVVALLHSSSHYLLDRCSSSSVERNLAWHRCSRVWHSPGCEGSEREAT